MPNYRQNTSALLAPEQVGPLLILPTLAASTAAQVANVVQTSSPTYRVPRVTADPSASWVAEGDEIAPSNLTVDEVVVTPAKVAGLNIASSELADDSDPSAVEAIGLGLARDIARKIDAAFFGNLPSPAPAGLGSLTSTVTTIYAGTSWSNLDPFAAAASAVEVVGASVTAWVAHPTDLLALARLKSATGSNLPLLAAQPGDSARRLVEGLSILPSPYVPVGTVWGVPADRTHLVVRKDAEVSSDRSVFYTSDRVAVRAIARVGFAFPHPQALVRIVVAATDPTA